MQIVLSTERQRLKSLHFTPRSDAENHLARQETEPAEYLIDHNQSMPRGSNEMEDYLLIESQKKAGKSEAWRKSQSINDDVHTIDLQEECESEENFNVRP